MKNVLRGTFIPGRFSAPKMNRDPHAGRFGARIYDAVSDMGGDQKPVARSQRALVAIVPEQARFSLQQRHPFVAVLVVPLALGRGLPDGDDALDAKWERVVGIARGGESWK